MTRCSLRVTLIVLAVALFSCEAQVPDQASVYEALFARLDESGLDRTYYVLETEGRPPPSPIDAEIPFPRDVSTHAAEDFGGVKVSLVSEGLFDSGCREGWQRFHERFPEAGYLVAVSKVVFDERADEAFVSAWRGRGCLGGSGAIHHLENQNGQWVVTRLTRPWVN